MLIPTGDKCNRNTLEPGCCFSLLVVLHGFDVGCPSMDSNFCPPLFGHLRGSRTNRISKFSVPSCRRSFGVKIQGSKPEKLGFHLYSCNMQLLANYTKYYTVDRGSEFKSRLTLATADRVIARTPDADPDSNCCVNL